MDKNFRSKYPGNYNTQYDKHNGYRTGAGYLYISVVSKRGCKHFTGNHCCKSRAAAHSECRKQSNDYFTSLNRHAGWQWFNRYDKQLFMDESFRPQYTDYYYTYCSQHNCHRSCAGYLHFSIVVKCRYKYFASNGDCSCSGFGKFYFHHADTFGNNGK